MESTQFPNASASIAQLAKALAAAQGKIETAPKGSMNPHFKSRYADLAAIVAACRRALSEAGIAVIQIPAAEGVKVRVTTLLVHASGEHVSGTLEMTARDASPQAIGSAITYGRRYGLASMVGVVADEEDDDGNATQSSVPQGVGLISAPGGAVSITPGRGSPGPLSPPRQPADPERAISAAQVKRLFAIIGSRTGVGWTQEIVHKQAQTAYRRASFNDLRPREYEDLCRAVLDKTPQQVNAALVTAAAPAHNPVDPDNEEIPF